ncbi:YkyA family protein [Neobacillus sp. K501]
MIIRKYLTVFSILVFVFILSGCISEQSSAEKLYKALEKVAAAEKQFEEQQEPLTVLEKQERDIYNKIMALGMKQHDEIVKLADEALVMVEKREDHLIKETESIKKSEEEFKKVGEIKEQLEEPKQKQKADELFDIMLKRYQAHSQLAKDYSEALVKDKELYTLLKNKNISFQELEKQVTTLNETYQKVLKVNEEFNTLTVQYNAKKLEFYQVSGLEIAEE